MIDKRLNKNKYINVLVLYKIIGIFVLVLLYSLIGEEKGALYSYAYNIYLIFFSLTSTGIIIAISKLTREYQDKGYYRTKERMFSLSKKLVSGISIFSFLILMIFADGIASLIVGDLVGSNSIDEVTLVIRLVACCLLISPIVNVYRGYLEGHQINLSTPISLIIEQLTSLIIIIIFGFTGIYLFHLSLFNIVCIALMSIIVGNILSWFYLKLVKYKNRKILSKVNLKVKERKITNKEIVCRVIVLALPFIMIEVFNSIYNSLDIFVLVKYLAGNIGYTKESAEEVVSILSLWGLNINQIIILIGVFVIVSLIPNLTDIVDKSKKGIAKIVNKIIQILIYVIIPITTIFSILSSNIWQLFYGSSIYGTSIYSYYVFIAFFVILFIMCITILLVLDEYRIVFMSLIGSFLTKGLLLIPLTYGFYTMGLPAYFGPITASILGYLVCIVISLLVLNKKYRVDYEDTIRVFIDIMSASIVMAIVLLLIKIYLPFNSVNRLINILIILLYIVIGGTIYIGITYKYGTIKKIIGKDLKKVIRRR